MVTVPEANRILWEELDAVYEAQREAAQQARQAIETIVDTHPEIGRDPLARDALRAAAARQDGIARFAESQVALAETMRAYWEQRTALAAGDPEPLPLVRRGNPFLPAPTGRRAPAITVGE